MNCVFKCISKCMKDLSVGVNMIKWYSNAP